MHRNISDTKPESNIGDVKILLDLLLKWTNHWSASDWFGQSFLFYYLSFLFMCNQDVCCKFLETVFVELILEWLVIASGISDQRNLELNPTVVKESFINFSFLYQVAKGYPILLGFYWSHYELKKVFAKTATFNVERQAGGYYWYDCTADLSNYGPKTELVI